MTTRLTPPTKDSEDYTATAIGAIFVTKPVLIELPRPIKALRFSPPVDAAGRLIPVPIYKCLIPICSEDYDPETSKSALIHKTIRSFWEDTLMPQLVPPHNRRFEAFYKVLHHIAHKNKSRGFLLPPGLECQIRFESLLTTSDLVPEIREDEATARGLYAFHAKASFPKASTPPKHPGRHSSTVIGMIVAQNGGRINLAPFGTLHWEPETLPNGQHRERPLFIDAIPLLPEEHCGIASINQRERKLLIDRFWDVALSTLIGRQKHAGLIICTLKERLRRIIDSQELLPKGLVARIGFGDMRPIEEQFPGIIPEELIIRKAMSKNWHP